MGICNGVSQTLDENIHTDSRGDAAIPSQEDIYVVVFHHMENMFYYIEKLVMLDDLQITSLLAKEILDLYSDIVLNCFHHIVRDRREKDGLGPSAADVSKFEEYVKRSGVHTVINQRFGCIVQNICNEGNQESVERFGKIVNEVILEKGQ
jgi:hypothetical protein